MVDNLIIKIKVGENKIVYIGYDLNQLAEYVDFELVEGLIESLLTHLKTHNVIEEFNIKEMKQ